MIPNSVSRRAFLAISMILVAIHRFSPVTLACMQGQVSPKYSLSRNSRVFVGSVGEYLPPILEVGCSPRYAFPGFVVVLEAEFGGSNLHGQRIELYPYRLGANCGRSPLQIEDLKALYPLGARLRIVAETWDACCCAETPIEGNTSRLFTSESYGDVARVMPGDPDPAASEPFDYSRVVGDRQSLGAAINFEVMKDFARLASATNEANRKIVLTRLLALPGYRGRGCEELIRANIQSEMDGRQLLPICRTDATGTQH